MGWNVVWNILLEFKLKIKNFNKKIEYFVERFHSAAELVIQKR